NPAANKSNGGALNLKRSARITIDFMAARIEENLAKNGGAISIIGRKIPNEDIVINGGDFVGNRATEKGGGIYAYEVKGMEVKNLTFKGAHLARDGAAIYLRNPGRRTSLERLDFEGCIAGRNAGAVMVSGAHPTPADAPIVFMKNVNFE